MSVKPTGSKALTDLWASTGTIVQPSAGKVALGWKTGERPPAQYKNWWANRVDTWLKYLDDGDIALNNLTVGGNTLLGNATGDTCAVSGPLTVGTTLGVTGDLTVGGNTLLGNATGDTCAVSGPLTVGTTLGVTGVVTASAGITLPAGQLIRHGIKTRIFHVTYNPTDDSARWLFTQSASTAHSRGIDLDVGVTIDCVRFYIVGKTGASGTAAFTHPGGSIAATAGFSGTGNFSLTTATGLAITLATGFANKYVATVNCTDTGGAGFVSFAQIEVDYLQS